MTPSPVSTLLKSSLAICLRGFDPHGHERAASLLSARGHRVVRSLAAAQFVVAGPDADNALLENTRARGLEIAPWDAIREELEIPATSAVEECSAPLAREATLPLLREEDGVRWLLDTPLPAATGTAPQDLRHVPDAGRFAGMCFDQPFTDTLNAVLTGVTHSMPVALEGETAASKTTAALYLAHLLNHPVVRLNLNGQTDAGELVGRHVPAEQGGWMFQEGALVQAMRRGHWLLLDEMNLAEPQVLERLNCALENPPTLVLSEGNGTVFGPRGDVEVDSRFRLMATLNPAEYSGRSVLSPAFRNRWLIWHQAQGPDEKDTLAMLRSLVFGEQPVVHWKGRAYQADAVTPLFPILAEVTGIDGILDRLALFHSTVAKACGADGGTPALGRHRRERDFFTRRNLTAALQLFSAALERDPGNPKDALMESVSRIYVNRHADAADRKAVRSHARAAGLC